MYINFPTEEGFQWQRNLKDKKIPYLHWLSILYVIDAIE